MRKLLLLSFASLFFVGQLLAQKTITGKVTDEKGDPVSNVSVTVKGTATGTTTLGSGAFSISVPANAKILVFSSVGLTTEERTIGTANNINLAMKSADKALEEVIITGYSREKKSQFTGAATVISAKAFEMVPVGAFDQTLQGRAPGVLVNSGSGQPGSSASITIRGVQSIQGAGAQPLYVLDGVPIPAFDMQTINANDFESITILKDAGAAALYGARGGTGVIVLTSKKGKAGPTNFKYSSQFGFTQAPNASNFDMMNTKEIMELERRYKLVNNPGWQYSKENPAYATLPVTAAPFVASQQRNDFLIDSIGNINTDYAKILFRQGLSKTHELNMSGGLDKTNYFISASYFDQQGTDLFSALKRYTTRFNLSHTSNKVSVQLNTTMGYSKTTFSEGEWLGNSARNSFQMVWRAKPYENPYNQNTGALIFGASNTLALKQIGNVIEGMNNTVLTQDQIKINTGLTVGYQLFPSIRIQNRFGFDVSNDRWQRNVNANSFIGSLQTFNSGYNAEANRINLNLINTSSIVFAKKYNNIHDVEIGGYFEAVRGYQKALGFAMWNLDPRLSLTGQGAGSLTTATTTNAQNASSAKSGYGIRSFFATSRYTYNNKYTVTGNIRRDGTSRILNEANKEITTWSAGAIWDLNRENFMKSQNIFSDAKLRVSYGEVPNIGSIATGGYGVTGGLVSATNFLGPQLASYGTTTGFVGSGVTGLVPTTAGNPNLKIETIEKLNIGLDLSAWRNRAKLNIDVYSNKTVDLFVSQPLPSTAGFGTGSLPINAGTMTNKGIELTLNIDLIQTKLFDLSIGGNHSINKNMIVDLGTVSEYQTGTSIIRKGLSFGSHYAQNYLGVDPATGRPVYEKLDGSMTTDVGQAGLFAKFGTYLPKHIGGFNTDIRIGNITVSALFSYQFDVTRYNNVENWITRGTTGYHGIVNASKRLLTEQWQKPGDVSNYQNFNVDKGFTRTDISDAKFIRFRNLNVAYQIPQFNVNNNKIIKGAKFYIQAQNLAIWSPWRGQDPEDNNNISLSEFPNPRMVVVGLDINF